MTCQELTAAIAEKNAQRINKQAEVTSLSQQLDTAVDELGTINLDLQYLNYMWEQQCQGA